MVPQLLVAALPRILRLPQLIARRVFFSLA